jgi:hypothetical protein
MPLTTRNRCFRVEIETPMEDSAKSIKFHREAVIEDGETFIGMAKDQPKAIEIPFLPTAAMTVLTVTDPVTGQQVTISGAGIAAWITAEYDALLAVEAAQIAAEAARIAQEEADRLAALEAETGPLGDTSPGG